MMWLPGVDRHPEVRAHLGEPRRMTDGVRCPSFEARPRERAPPEQAQLRLSGDDVGEYSERSQLALYLAAKAVDHAFARQRHQLHVAGLAGLEAHGGAGGDIEPHAAGLLAVEFQRGIGLVEMVVRAD